MDKNLASFLERVVERSGPKPALLYGPGNPGTLWTYQDLWERSSRVACWLQERGIVKGDRIIIWGPNSPWWVACYFGALRNGAILVPLDVRSGPDFAGR